MTCVYFGNLKGKILQIRPDEALVLFNDKDPLRWLPSQKLSKRITRDVDGSIIPCKYIEPLIDVEPFQTILFDDNFGVLIDRNGDILTLRNEGVFTRSIQEAKGVIMEGDKIVNKKLLREVSF